MFGKFFSKITIVLFLVAFFIPSSEILSASNLDISLSPSSQLVSTTANINFVFTPTNPLINGSQIQVNFPSTYSGGNSLTNSDIITTATNLTSSSASNFTSTGFKISIVASASITTSVTIVVGSVNKLTTPTVAGNYPFSITTSTGDIGAVFQYVGSSNQVLVTAIVPGTLGFVIRDSLDTVNTNTCDLGILSTSIVSSCNYRLKITTNSPNGFSVSIFTSGNFTSGSYNFANAAVGSGGSGGTSIVPGTETYGVLINKGLITSGTISLTPNYNAGSSNSVFYANTIPATLLNGTGPNSPTGTGDLTYTTLVTHNASIISGTASGFYSQTITYTVTPIF